MRCYPTPIPPQPGQESVWEYPRPPRLEICRRHVQVIYSDGLIGESWRSLRILETSHPPTYYLPPEDVHLELLISSSGSSFCEWKGQASYFDLDRVDGIISRVAWTYANPVPAYVKLRNYIAFYPGKVACYVDEERVQPQPGDFYGGWITSEIVGPYKGEPGSESW